MKKLLVGVLKVAISLAIVGYLIVDAQRNAVFTKLCEQPKDWAFLALAGGMCITAVMLTLVRWYCLVRALEIPLTREDALRLGLLGYLFNLAPMGIVGGDLLKAIMLARESRGRPAKAVASVVVDRIVGLYLLFVVASAAIVLTGFWRLPSVEIQTVCKLALVVTALGTLAVAVLLAPALTDGPLARTLARLPRVGPHLEGLIEAVRMYRRRPGVLAAAALMSVGVHVLFATGVYCIARGLPGDVHSLATHYVVMPLSAVAGVLPLPMGPFEWVLDTLYATVPVAGGAMVLRGQGLVVALGYRIIGVLIAAVGACYYLGSRREVAEVMELAEQHDDPRPLVEPERLAA